MLDAPQHESISQHGSAGCNFFQKPVRPTLHLLLAGALSTQQHYQRRSPHDYSFSILLSSLLFILSNVDLLQKRRPLWIEERDDLPWDFFQDWLRDAASALQLAADAAPLGTPIAWHTQHYPQVPKIECTLHVQEWRQHGCKPPTAFVC